MKVAFAEMGTSVHFPVGLSDGNGRKRVELKQANDNG